MFSTQKSPAVGCLLLFFKKFIFILFTYFCFLFFSACFSLLQHFVDTLKSCQLFKIFLTPDSDQIHQAVSGIRRPYSGLSLAGIMTVARGTLKSANVGTVPFCCSALITGCLPLLGEIFHPQTNTNPGLEQGK